MNVQSVSIAPTAKSVSNTPYNHCTAHPDRRQRLQPCLFVYAVTFGRKPELEQKTRLKRHKRQSSTFVIAPQVDNAISGALRYMARTKQRRTSLSLTFPSRSRYSFTDPERMEG